MEADVLNTPRDFTHSIFDIFIKATALLLLAPLTVLAQVPYSIDGIVPDANCCSEFQDPVGSIKELQTFEAGDLAGVHCPEQARQVVALHV